MLHAKLMDALNAFGIFIGNKGLIARIASCCKAKKNVASGSGNWSADFNTHNLTETGREPGAFSKKFTKRARGKFMKGDDRLVLSVLGFLNKLDY